MDRRYGSCVHNYSHLSHQAQSLSIIHLTEETERMEQPLSSKIHVLWLGYIIDD